MTSKIFHTHTKKKYISYSNNQKKKGAANLFQYKVGVKKMNTTPSQKTLKKTHETTETTGVVAAVGTEASETKSSSIQKRVEEKVNKEWAHMSSTIRGTIVHDVMRRLNSAEYTKDADAYLKNWKKQRGKTEVLRLPEDASRRILSNLTSLVSPREEKKTKEEEDEEV